MTSTLVSILITIDKLTLYSQTKIDPGVFHIIIHCLHDNGENKRGRQRNKQHMPPPPPPPPPWASYYLMKFNFNLRQVFPVKRSESAYVTSCMRVEIKVCHSMLKLYP